MIHEHSDVSQWHYVDTKNNPADIASRGLLPDNRTKTEFWIQGSAFLRRSEDYWPPRPAVLPLLPISDPEVKVKEVSAVALAENPPFNRLITCYSSWFKLVRAIAWMKRFQLFLLKKLAKKTSLEPETGCLSVEELQRATMYVICYTQDDVFEAVKAKLTDFEEYPCLNRVGSSCGKCCPSSLRKLRPIMVQGVLRVGGRLKNSGLSVDQRHPAILPARHHVTGLIVQFYHVQQGHCGTQSVLSATRQVLDCQSQLVGSTLPERMQAVSMLQAASLQTADGTFAEMPRYVRHARFHLYRSRLLRAYSCQDEAKPCEEIRMHFHVHGIPRCPPGSRLLPRSELFSSSLFSFYSSTRRRLGNI